MEKYVVVKTHNFDPETEATEFTDYRKATAYLHWLWEEYYNDELAEDEHRDEGLDENECFHEETYAKVQWIDGDYTEFTLITITQPREDFPEDWEKYVID